MSVETAKEIRALDQLTVTFCRHAPTLIDAKVVLLDESADGSKGYVTYWLTSFVEGVSLKDGLFWTFPQAKRDVVRRAFQATLRYVVKGPSTCALELSPWDSDIHACWVTIPSKPCNLLVDDVEGRVYITSFRNSDTYNQFNADKFKHVLDPYYTHWRNSWFADWGLTSSEISDGESYDDGSCFSEFACAYTAGSGDDSRVFPKRDIIKVLGSRVEVDDAVVASGDKREKKGVFYALRKVLQRA